MKRKTQRAETKSLEEMWSRKVVGYTGTKCMNFPCELQLRS